MSDNIKFDYSLEFRLRRDWFDGVVDGGSVPARELVELEPLLRADWTQESAYGEEQAKEATLELLRQRHPNVPSVAWEWVSSYVDVPEDDDLSDDDLDAFSDEV